MTKVGEPEHTHSSVLSEGATYVAVAVCNPAVTVDRAFPPLDWLVRPFPPHDWLVRPSHHVTGW